MKLLTALIGLVLLAVNVNGQPLNFNKKTKIYLVRHAEKEAGTDPVLTDVGKKRAGDLMRRLKNKHINRLYVTQYRRTQMTGDSLRILLKIDTVHYIADTLCDDLVSSIMKHNDFGKSILIIAHSNTIPKIIRKLGVHGFPQTNIPDEEFDNLFFVTYKNSKARITKMKYGNKSGVSSVMQ